MGFPHINSYLIRIFMALGKANSNLSASCANTCARHCRCRHTDAHQCTGCAVCMYLVAPGHTDRHSHSRSGDAACEIHTKTPPLANFIFFAKRAWVALCSGVGICIYEWIFFRSGLESRSKAKEPDTRCICICIGH